MANNHTRRISMKKLIAIALVLVMTFAVTACGGSDPDTVGTSLLNDFKANPAGSAQEIADRVITNDVIQFPAVTMPVEPGLLAGFDNAEITGFEEGVMFSPMMGTIPFIGYVFTLADDADVEGFKQNLETNANLRWNICTEAEEMHTAVVGNKVFFVMCPKTMEE